MALNKLYYVYGLDTACFYTDKENEIEKYLLKAGVLRTDLNRGTLIIKTIFRQRDKSSISN